MPLPAIVAVLARAAGPALIRAVGGGAGSATAQAAARSGAQGAVKAAKVGAPAASQAAPRSAVQQAAAAKTPAGAANLQSPRSIYPPAKTSARPSLAAKSIGPRATPSPANLSQHFQSAGKLGGFWNGSAMGGGGGGGGAGPPAGGPPGRDDSQGGDSSGGAPGGGASAGGFDFSRALGAFKRFNPLSVTKAMLGGAASAAIGVGNAATSAVAGPAEQRVFGEFGDTVQRLARLDLRALAEMPGNLRRWSDALLESRRHLAQFNASLAGTFARAEVRDIQRSIASGQRTAGTTDRLSESFNDLKDEIQPYGDAVTNSLNLLVGVANRGLAEFLRIAPMVSPMARTLKAIADAINKLSPRPSGKSGLQEWLDSINASSRRDHPAPPLARLRHRP